MPLLFPHIQTSDLISYFFLGFLIFIAIREFIMWYWKINKIVAVLERIENLLEEQSSNNKPVLSLPKNSESITSTSPATVPFGTL